MAAPLYKRSCNQVIQWPIEELKLSTVTYIDEPITQQINKQECIREPYGLRPTYLCANTDVG